MSQTDQNTAAKASDDAQVTAASSGVATAASSGAAASSGGVAAASSGAASGGVVAASGAAATSAAAPEAQSESRELIKDLASNEKSVKRYQRFVIRLLIVIAVIWVLFFQIIGLTHMPSGDMYPRVDAGDMVLFYRLDTDVRAQDIVVIEKETPDSNGAKQMFISRVIAKGGDTVDFKDGRVIVNGNTLVEDGIFYSTPTFEGLGTYPLVLGPGECFVLGDKREEAADSRFFGAVQRDEIKGTVITILRRNNL